MTIIIYFINEKKIFFILYATQKIYKMEKFTDPFSFFFAIIVTREKYTNKKRKKKRKKREKEQKTS